MFFRLSATRLVLIGVLSVPTWWAIDKALQIAVTRRFEAEVFANLRSEAFLAELFSIPQPVRYSDYSYTVGWSLTDNDFARQMEQTGIPASKPFRMYLIMRPQSSEEEPVVYEYRIAICGRTVCPYDATQALLAPHIDAESFDTNCAERHQAKYSLWFSLVATYRACFDKSWALSSATGFVANEARNPMDRAIRQLENARGPEYSQIQNSLTLSYVRGEEYYLKD